MSVLFVRVDSCAETLPASTPRTASTTAVTISFTRFMRLLLANSFEIWLGAACPRRRCVGLHLVCLTQPSCSCLRQALTRSLDNASVTSRRAGPHRYRGWSGWAGDGNFCRARASSTCRIVCLDSARRIGAKILVSGGSRCNVTNRVVTERDFWGGSTRFVRNVLRAFPETRAVEFFSELGVTLHEEEDGKLFPDSNTSRTVLSALAARNRTPGDHGRSLANASMRLPMRARPFVTATDAGRTIRSQAVVLCTGGRSLPKTGSDGFGYELARRFGHDCVVDDSRPCAAAVRGVGPAWRGCRIPQR